MTEAFPDHSTLSQARRLIDVETHVEVFTWVVEQLAAAGLVPSAGTPSTTAAWRVGGAAFGHRRRSSAQALIAKQPEKVQLSEQTSSTGCLGREGDVVTREWIREWIAGCRLAWPATGVWMSGGRRFGGVVAAAAVAWLLAGLTGSADASVAAS